MPSSISQKHIELVSILGMVCSGYYNRETSRLNNRKTTRPERQRIIHLVALERRSNACVWFSTAGAQHKDFRWQFSFCMLFLSSVINIAAKFSKFENTQNTWLVYKPTHVDHWASPRTSTADQPFSRFRFSSSSSSNRKFECTNRPSHCNSLISTASHIPTRHTLRRH